MKKLYDLKFINLYEQAYKTSTDLQALSNLKTVYKMRADFVEAFLQKDDKQIAAIKAINSKLGHALKKAITHDDRILNGSEDLPTIIYEVESQKIDFKVESGNRTSVAHAINIKWDADLNYLNEVYEAYNKNKPKGPLTKEKLAKLPEEFQETNFGSISQFDLVIKKAKKDSDEQDIIYTIKKDLEVIAISSPKIGGKREEIRPIIQLSTKGPGFEKGKLQAFALTSRENTKYRVLAGADLLQEAGISIIYGKHDDRFLDPEKVDLQTVKAVLDTYTA